jgi:hypothetical protein
VSKNENRLKADGYDGTPTPMRRLFYISVLFFISLSGNARGITSQETGVFRIGVSSSGFNEINRNDAAAALKAWAATVAKEQGLQDLFEVTLLPGDFEGLRSALIEGRLNGISLSVAELMDLDLQVTDVYIPVRDKGPETRYALIVHTEGGISDPKNLMTRKIVMESNERMKMALPWLETLLADTGGQTKEPEHPAIVENPSKAILQVFFHQSDAALVVAEAFNLACELNPQLRKDLKVLAESPPFIISVFVFPSTFSHGKDSEAVERALLDLHTTPGGRQVLTVFKSARMGKYPVSILDGTIQFIQAYRHRDKASAALEARP